MSFAKVYSAEHVLLNASIITIEVDLSRGLHLFSIVGLPDKGVAESKDRVSAAIKNSGFVSPKSKNQKVVVSLAPADIKKEGPVFDLAIALAYLLAAEDIAFDPKEKLFLGELSLDGKLRKIKGVLPQVIEAKKKGFKEVFLPRENSEEAALICDIDIFGADTLLEVIHHVNIKKLPNTGKEIPILISPTPQTIVRSKERTYQTNICDIRGQETAKRGLEIAAAGGHNIALYGPPGTGKTMLAKAFHGLLPALSFQEVLEVTSIHSIAGTLKEGLVTEPPLRAPHHGATHAAMVGGGSSPRPGEITLAHYGVLFLDELPEFDRRVIDSLRQPLEDRTINVSRSRASAYFPANFILIATMNPCPCGNLGLKQRECSCSVRELHQYSKKISGPIIDRIDMWIEVPFIEYTKLVGDTNESETTEDIRERVVRTRAIQKDRFAKLQMNILFNSEIPAKNIIETIAIEKAAEELLVSSAATLELSARSYHRVLKLARTIADLDQQEKIKGKHILEALQYRPKRNGSDSQ